METNKRNKAIHRLIDATAPVFQGELQTALSAKAVMERVGENTSNDVSWFKSRVAPFWGTTSPDQFRISDRDNDPGVVLKGSVRRCNGTTYVTITARCGITSLIGTGVIGTGFTWAAWHSLHPVYPIAAYLSLIGIPALLVILRLSETSDFWSEMHNTLDTLRRLIDADVVYRSHDAGGRRLG